ncbi:MAG TPA: biopolymer transporter ExbD [Bacteroidales bacterium]|nr:biopolymer transporter ExbD [Bacteroidales bacterium]HOK98704.1 biopolymer transporter ExbD [Bacteroidales bacterium]HPO65602.1 biopolymer transporter ExbD [Bacteroidales bacterium]
MRIERRKTRTSEVYVASLNDIMFFLLLFFLIVSTMVNPSVIKLLLPRAEHSEQTVSKQTINLTITKDLKYYLNDEEISPDKLEFRLKLAMRKAQETTVILRADNEITLQPVVDVIDLGNKLKIKVILATRKQ